MRRLVVALLLWWVPSAVAGESLLDWSTLRAAVSSALEADPFPEVAGSPLRERQPKLYSRNAFVLDVDSGEVLLSRRADEPWSVASLSKLVTALAARRAEDDLDRSVCLDGSMMPSWPGARTKLRPGTCLQGWDLVGASLVASDNGAAIALGDWAGLPPDVFVDAMNETARGLGMTDSHFVDPSGADDENVSTARDMARAILATAEDPVLSDLSTTPAWAVDMGGHTRVFRSTNALLGDRHLRFQAAKTGYTDTARHCFAAVVEADGRRLVVVTLGARKSSHRWKDVRALIGWASVRSGR